MAVGVSEIAALRGRSLRRGALALVGVGDAGVGVGVAATGFAAAAGVDANGVALGV